MSAQRHVPRCCRGLASEVHPGRGGMEVGYISQFFCSPFAGEQASESQFFPFNFQVDLTLPRGRPDSTRKSSSCSAMSSASPQGRARPVRATAKRGEPHLPHFFSSLGGKVCGSFLAFMGFGCQDVCGCFCASSLGEE